MGAYFFRARHWLLGTLSSIRRVLRGRRMRILGLIGGCVMLVIGLSNSAQRFDLGSRVAQLGTLSLISALLLDVLVLALGASAWALVATALAPEVKTISAIQAYFSTMPLKYLPGFILSHVGKAVWFGQEIPPLLTETKVGGRIPLGVVAASLDFGLLLWSGLVATFLSSLSEAPTLVRGLIATEAWRAWAAMAVGGSIVFPVFAGIVLKRQVRGPRLAFTIRIWLSGALQIVAWMVSGHILMSLAIGLSGSLAAHPSPGDSVLALFLGIVGGLLALVVPNGLGVREAIASLAFAGTVSAEVGFAAAFVLRVVAFVAEISLFLIQSIAALVITTKSRTN